MYSARLRKWRVLGDVSQVRQIPAFLRSTFATSERSIPSDLMPPSPRLPSICLVQERAIAPSALLWICGGNAISVFTPSSASPSPPPVAPSSAARPHLPPPKATARPATQSVTHPWEIRVYPPFHLDATSLLAAPYPLPACPLAVDSFGEVSWVGLLTFLLVRVLQSRAVGVGYL